MLLAEDNALNQQVAQEILRRAGARVVVAGNGGEALERLEQEPFDVALLDLQMPGMGGIETAQAVRRNPRWDGLALIALTADAQAGVRERVLAAGMDDCITKPINPYLLVRALADRVPRTGFTPGTAAEAPEAAPGWRLPGVDSEAAARLGLDLETHLHLLWRFVAAQRSDLAALRTALDSGELAEAGRQAHSLKGSALNLGANRVAGTARDLESLLEQDRPGGWDRLLARIQEQVQEIAQGLSLLPGAPAPPIRLDGPAALETLEALRQCLGEDDARAGQHLARLEALVKSSPLQAALAPLKARVAAYDYQRALQLLPAFQARVERERDGL